MEVMHIGEERSSVIGNVKFLLIVFEIFVLLPIPWCVHDGIHISIIISLFSTYISKLICIFFTG